MRFYVVSNERAADYLSKLHKDATATLMGSDESVGAGEMLDEATVQALAKDLEELQSRAKDDKEFDAEACVIVHKSLPRDEEMLSSDGFWRWLALVPLRQVTIDRFKKELDVEDEDSSDRFVRPQNFGVGSSARQRAECYPYKLWLRAELSYAEDQDPYRFARRGDVDFWTSHIHRQSYTTNRTLCAELIKYQYPDQLAGAPRLHPGTENPAVGALGIRTLAKRIRRLQASFELTFLSADELAKLIAQQAEDLKPAKQG